MALLEGRFGIIMGVANARSIATACARSITAEGGACAFSYLPDTTGKNKTRVLNALEGLEPVLVAPCDVAVEDSLEEFFKSVGQQGRKIDFIVHAIAYAPVEDLRGPTMHASRQGFQTAMDISVYSLLAVARHAQPLFAPGASLTTLSYLGGERVVPGYNLMGVVKSALDASVRYLAAELGPQKVRVNAVSSGPVRTLAASAIKDLGTMLDRAGANTPLQRNITVEEVAKTVAFLASDRASGITGELLHVDAGAHIMAALPQM